MRERYWHIQMFLPNGKGGGEIDSIKMLQESSPVIGTGEWDDIQCSYFKGERNGLKVGDIVLVREGKKLLALCEIISDYFTSAQLEKKFINKLYRHVKVLGWNNEKRESSLFTQGTLKILYRSSDTASYNYINDWYKKILAAEKMENIKKLLTYKKQIILQGPPGTGKTREAKLIAKEILGLNSVDDLKNSYQFTLIQFHPSYTYEDFVRGIVARPNPVGEGMQYTAENKVLGDFAERALKNFLDAQKAPEVVSKESWVRERYQIFKDNIETDLENQEVLIKEGTKPKIIAIEIDAIRVNRYSNEKDSVLIKDSDIINGYIGLNFSNPAVKIKENTILSKSARSGMYYLYQNLIGKFDSFLQENNFAFDENSNMIKVSVKPYVFIVDEINRANLSSVLGELIYALEYRGEAVDSMYTIENESKNKLILPPNLYIIGTMNTADRSVGHIDYAIRRRFAFVDILPQDLTNDNTIKFDGDLFRAVKELFTTDNYKTHSNYLSREFDPKDVALGHSYFIQHYEKDANSNEDKTKPIDFKFRLDYEIKPILREYVKDGVLIGEKIKEKIEALAPST